MSFKIYSNDPDHELVTKVRIHRESMVLTTLTALILCHALQRKLEKFIKKRGARAEPSLMNPLFLDVFW